MNKIAIIIQKELLEIRLQRGLLLSLVLPPILLTLLPIGTLYATTQASGSSTNVNASSSLLSIPALAGMMPKELTQALIGMQFSVIYLLLPLLIPSIVAAYSIVGEKTSHTLEPVLATPIRTWELLLGKSLTALIPALGITWLCGGVFIAAVSALAVSTRVFNAIVSPGWLIVFLVWTPLLALIAIAVMVGISSRVNDPRTAQQLSAWVVVPFLALFFGQLSGVVVLSPTLALGVVIVLLPLAVIAVWIASQLFGREAILTRWK